MGLFKRKQQLHACPICAVGVEKDAGMDHWMGHVRQIPPGQGDASGQFTWECTCGPSGMKWPNDFSAANAMAIHMQRRHSIPAASPLDDPTFMSLMERQLGLR